MKINVEGLAALEEQLLELGAQASVQVLSAAARKAFKPVVDDAKAKVAADTEALRDAIRLRTKKPSSGKAVVIVGLGIAGPSRKQKRMAKVQRRLVKRGMAHAIDGKDLTAANPMSRWHFEEFGTARTRARPYIRPAFDANVEQMVGTLKVEIGRSIQRALRRKAKAGK